MNLPQTVMRKGGIARRLILAMVLFSSTITLVVTAIQLYRDYSRDLQFIESQLDQIEEVHQRSIADNLWSLDIVGIQLLADGIVRLPDMLYVEVREAGQVVASAGSRQIENTIQRSYTLTHKHLGQILKIGEITVVATLDLLYQRLIDKAVDILVSNFFKTFLVAGFMLLVFHLLVTRHLIGIADFARSQKFDEVPVPLRLERKDRSASNPDELDLVVAELNLMRANLHSSYNTLMDSEKKHRELYDTMAQGVVYQDENGVITSANTAAQKILGLTIDQLLGITSIDPRWKTIHEDGENFPGETHPAMLALSTGKVIDNVVMGVYLPIQDTHHWIMINSKPQFHAGEERAYQVYSTFTDITVRKHADEERKLLIKDLESINIELERFVYTVSHELKSPLVTIGGFVGILCADIARGKIDKIDSHVRQINSAIKTMSALLEDLLQLARIGHQIAPPVTLGLDELVRDVAIYFQFQAAENSIIIKIGADLPQITGDRLRLGEVFQNLLENAIKFIGSQPEPLIEIGGQIQGDELVCFVKDNGIGIERDYHQRIFELFEHLDPKVEGTGVGLALAERIVKLHGGRIWVESDGLGKGSTFYFALPRTEQDKPG